MVSFLPDDMTDEVIENPWQKLARAARTMAEAAEELAQAQSHIDSPQAPVDSPAPPLDAPPPSRAENQATDKQRGYIVGLIAKCTSRGINPGAPYGSPFTWDMTKDEAGQIINKMRSALNE